MKRFILILVFFVQIHLIYGQNNGWRFIELGISCEQSYEDHALCQPVAYRTQAIHSDREVSVMPNPATDRIRITGTEITEVQLMDVSGSIVKEQQASGVAEVEMDISKLLPGIYMVRVVYGEQYHTAIKKLIKLR